MAGFLLSGFADEAGDSIQEQIRATKTLGWSHIEARNINGKNITDITEDEFENLVAVLSCSGVTIDCFASNIANWAKDPRKEEDYVQSVAELSRAIPRMRRLNIRYVRGMSFRAIKDARPDSVDIEDLVVRKLDRLVGMCEVEGLIYLHENCANFGGLSWEHTLRLCERLDSPAFRLVFDTGNPIGTYDRRGMPWNRQSTLEFYLKVKHFVDRIHIKDARFVAPTGSTFNDLEYLWPGEGEGQVREVLENALVSGFRGPFSIEPHLAAVYHAANGERTEVSRFDTYIEYGKRFESLLKLAVKNDI